MSLNTFRFPSVTELVLTWYRAVFLHMGHGGDQKGKEAVGSFSKYPGRVWRPWEDPTLVGAGPNPFVNSGGFPGVWCRKGRNHESRGQSGSSGGGSGIGVRARDVGVGKGGVEGGEWLGWEVTFSSSDRTRQVPYSFLN